MTDCCVFYPAQQALSRPDISHALLERKTIALEEARKNPPQPEIILTNCPSCVQGLDRIGGSVKPRHISVELALRIGGAEWMREFKRLIRRAELITF
jgi:Fe-S oxidoreductase